MIDPELLQLLSTLGVSAGAAFVGGKNSLNGFKSEIRSNLSSMDARVVALHADIMEVKGDVKALHVQDSWHEDRIHALEVARRAAPPLDISAGDA